MISDRRATLVEHSNDETGGEIAMEHLAYYNTGCEPGGDESRFRLWARRRLRQVLLPASLRMVQILASICGRLDASEHEIRDLRGQIDDLRRRQEDQAAKLPATIAFGWDYVAMVRRLSVLEEHVDSLLVAREEAEPALGLAITDAVESHPVRARVG